MPIGFNVNQFKGAVNQNDILRTNNFRMEFQTPRGMIGHQTHYNTLRFMEYWCEISAQPGINFLTTDARKYAFGPMQKRPYVTSFNDLSVTFYDDGYGDNWRFFDDWNRLINNSTLSKDENIIDESDRNNAQAESMYPYELSYRDDYITDVMLKVYDNEGTVIKTIKFREMYPLNIADSPLSWADNNSLLRFTVNLTFLEWYEIDPQIARQYVETPKYYKTAPNRDEPIDTIRETSGVYLKR